MSNETIIIQQENLFLNVAGRRITALPDTGTIASMEKLTPESAIVGGLHKTSAIVINGSDSFRLTINVMPMSEDDEYLDRAIRAVRASGKILAVSLTYGETKYVSGACVIETRPTRNYNADGAEVLSYPFIGTFTVASVRKFTNPDTLTEDEIFAA